MCLKCGFSAIAGHWSEEAARTPQDLVQARIRRLQILQAVLRPYGFKVANSTLGAALRLTAPNGEAELVQSLDELWPRLEGLLGAPLDPLSPHFTRNAGEAS